MCLSPLRTAAGRESDPETAAIGSGRTLGTDAERAGSLTVAVREGTIPPHAQFVPDMT